MKKFLGPLVWIITAIGAINWGLDALGYNIFLMRPLVSVPSFVYLFKLFVGLTGIVSLAMFFGDKK